MKFDGGTAIFFGLFLLSVFVNNVWGIAIGFAATIYSIFGEIEMERTA